MSSKTWLITGTSTGLGRLMTERLLARGDIAYSALSRNYHRRHQSSVTISNFNQQQLDEIGAMQKKAARLVPLDSAKQRRASDYLDELRVQFGLKKAG